MGLEVVIIKPNKYEYFDLGKGFSVTPRDEIFSRESDHPQSINHLTTEDIYNSLCSRSDGNWNCLGSLLQSYFRGIAEKIKDWAGDDPVYLGTDNGVYELEIAEGRRYKCTGSRYKE